MIRRPTLLLDRNRCLKNIQRMVEKATQNQIELRPHFKTHQSHVIGRWFRNFGIKKITVSSLEMAAYFAEDGWSDITVAFPTNLLEIDLINELAGKIKLNLLVQSVSIATFLNAQLSHPVCCLIKVDLGTHRTGIQPDDFELLDFIIQTIETSPKLVFNGFIGHAGHSYSARGLDQIQVVHNEAMSKMSLIYHYYQENYPNICISIGDTPTCSRMSSFGCATEIRPGNFVFYDLMQEQIEACSMDDIAVALACPIVALHPERNEVVVYGGGVHFSKEVYSHTYQGTCYGLIVKQTKEGWSSPIPNVYVKKLSQEHGIIQGPNEFIRNCHLGQLLYILPVHSCMTANLLKKLQTTDGETIHMMNVL